MASEATSSRSASISSISSKSSKASDPKKRFQCQHQGCDKSFSRSEHLHRHALNHKVGNSTCQRCFAHFRRRDLLDRHMARHREKDEEAGGEGLGKLATRKRLWRDDDGNIVNSRRPSFVQQDGAKRRQLSHPGGNISPSAISDGKKSARRQSVAAPRSKNPTRPSPLSINSSSTSLFNASFKSNPNLIYRSPTTTLTSSDDHQIPSWPNYAPHITQSSSALEADNSSIDGFYEQDLDEDYRNPNTWSTPGTLTSHPSLTSLSSRVSPSSYTTSSMPSPMSAVAPHQTFMGAVDAGEELVAGGFTQDSIIASGDVVDGDAFARLGDVTYDFGSINPVTGAAEWASSTGWGLGLSRVGGVESKVREEGVSPLGLEFYRPGTQATYDTLGHGAGIGNLGGARRSGLQFKRY